MSKNKNIPQWQKSVFDKSVDKISCVKTKPISTSMVKKIEKDFFDQNFYKIKIKDPELFIIKLPERILNNDTFSNEEKKQLVKTLKGTYYIYEWD